MRKRRGFGWIVGALREGKYVWSDSQVQTWAKTSGTKGAKRRDNKRDRQRAKREQEG